MGIAARPNVSQENKRGVEEIKIVLYGPEVADVEYDLADGAVKNSTLDKLEKLNTALADTCLDHIEMNLLVREFWRRMVHIKIEHDKTSEKALLSAIEIPVLEG